MRTTVPTRLTVGFLHAFVPGVASPIGVGPSRGHHAVLAYLSLEHPIRRSH